MSKEDHGELVTDLSEAGGEGVETRGACGNDHSENRARKRASKRCNKQIMRRVLLLHEYCLKNFHSATYLRNSFFLTSCANLT